MKTVFIVNCGLVTDRWFRAAARSGTVPLWSALTENGGDLQAAVDRIAATIHRVESEFDHHATTLRAGLAGDDTGLRVYLDALEAMIAGNLEWSYLTPRYNGRGHRWNGLTEAAVVLAPDRTLYLPLEALPSRTRERERPCLKVAATEDIEKDVGYPTEQEMG
ncbi:hypothetical protein ACFYXC_37385 [Streptomyces sp. NPDC002701]|uniref:hypothetical protein n=1 Tax=Streptomyces sp. NPDC002701 TaxID=3364661 RepID=UPI0036979CDC